MNVLYVKLKQFIHASLVTYQFVIVQLVVTAVDPKHRNYSEEL